MSAALRLVKSAGELPDHDRANLPEQLRQIAHDCESGLMMGAKNAVIIVDRPGADLMVYGVAEGDHVLRLQAAFMLLALAQRELESIAAQIRE